MLTRSLSMLTLRVNMAPRIRKNEMLIEQYWAKAGTTNRSTQVGRTNQDSQLFSGSSIPLPVLCRILCFRKFLRMRLGRSRWEAVFPIGALL